MLNLSGKVALVTGCGSMGPGWGNGKAIAVLLARQGASVFGVDLDLEAARVTEQLIRDEGGTVEVMSADVKQAGEVQRMVQACVKRFGRIDILVNNVGRSEPGGPVDMAEDVWDEQMDINAKTAFLCMKHVLPLREQQGSGSVVSLSSVAGLR